MIIMDIRTGERVSDSSNEHYNQELCDLVDVLEQMTKEGIINRYQTITATYIKHGVTEIGLE